jgi:hypothetical protein
MSVVVKVKITDKEIWMEFQRYVLRKYGKTYGVLGKELVEALKHYLESKASTHTQILQVSRLYPSNQDYVT